MKHTPLFATSKTAASLLEMKEAEFLRLVEKGALPRPARFDRWDVEQLKKAMNGDYIGGLGGVAW